MSDCKIKPKVIQTPVITLNSFFEENNIDFVDIISVDVEGWEPEVIDGFDEKKIQCQILCFRNEWLQKLN